MTNHMEQLEDIDAKLESMKEHMMVVEAQLNRLGLLPNYLPNGQPNKDAMTVGTIEYHWQAIESKHNYVVTELMKLMSEP